MDAVREDIKQLVTKELAAANEKFPQFRSLHEGAAVLLEEIEELRDEVRYINGYYSDLWEFVRMDGYDLEGLAESVKIHAINAAVEAVQVAAMAEKFLYALEHDGEAEERPRGEWIDEPTEGAWTTKCTYCGTEKPQHEHTYFCPDCGADMRKEG